jgi:small subunit ribosomal protein S4
LELRLDNVAYRMGFAASRNEAKQFVRHNHVNVNGKRVNIPSARVKVGDVITVNEKMQKHPRLVANADLYSKRAALPWIDVDHTKMTGKVIALPQRGDIQLQVTERHIVELYNK